ncbi:fungal-specific transcription factor domain-containing protein [Xylariomycetidae sp. FL2044]|nr:fungal-specific transcription factor domain-containing protein [Xylariomycetidae sp. FL2044]
MSIFGLLPPDGREVPVIEPPAPQSAAVRPQPKPLSCTSCRARKLKCDRKYPCATCVKSGSQCVFPARKRIQRPRKTKNLDLLQRLNRLESIVGQAGLSGLDVEPAAGGTQTVPTETHETQTAIPDGKASQYLSREFWTNLCGEVEGLKVALEQSTDSDDEDIQGASPDSGNEWPNVSPSASPAFLTLGTSPHSVPERVEHPAPDHIRFLLETYFTNVDMFMKILHRPTISAALNRLADSPETASQLGSEREALFFSIYHGAVATLTPEICKARLGQSRAELIQLYSAGVEHFLAKADYLNNDSLETLQAVTLYMACLRSYDGSRSSWVLISIPIRLAHALNLHQDGDGSLMAPFEAEQRRRLWWALLVLDTRAAEDRGSTTVIMRNSYNTRLPHNIDDADFGPESTEPLVDRAGPTDITILLSMAQSSGVFMYVEFAQRGFGPLSTLPPTEEETIGLARRLESQFVTGADLSHRCGYIASVIVRIITLKLWLVMAYPVHTRNRGSTTSGSPATGSNNNNNSNNESSPPQPQKQQQQQQQQQRIAIQREKTLLTAIAVIELIEASNRGPHAANFAWWAKTYPQWHPLAVALAELSTQTRGEAADRAWTVVESVFERYSGIIADSRRGTLWRPIRKLYKKAKAARDKARREDPAAGTRMVGGRPTEIIVGTMDDGSEAHIRSETQQQQQQQQMQAQAHMQIQTQIQGQDDMMSGLGAVDMSSSYPLNPALMSWTDFSFDTVPDMGDLDSMDWSTWNEFVLDTHGGASKSGSSEEGWQ